MNPPSTIFFLVLLCSPLFKYGQTLDYIPLRNYSPDSSLIEAVTLRYKYTISSLDLRRDVKKEVAASFNELCDYVNAMYHDSRLMYNDSLSNYVREITDKIVSKNPAHFNTGYKTMIYRSSVANAGSFGQGLVLVNLALICNLKSEDELAFVICHELSHDIKNHVLNGIIKRSELLRDKRLLDEVEIAKSKKYNPNSEIEKLYNKYLFNVTEHSRSNELEADSLGLLLYLNSGYTPSVALITIQQLDSIDSPEYKFQLPLTTIFNFKDFPFKPVWLEYDQDATWTSNLDSSYKVPDSLKTHPDCRIRAEKIERNLKSAAPIINIPQHGDTYALYKKIAVFEKVEYLMDTQQYGFALYNCLQLLQQNPNNRYLHTSASYCLFQIHYALVNHNFSSVVDFPDKAFSGPYNEYLKFIHNISSSSLKEIAKNYFLDNTSGFDKTDYYFFTGSLIKSMGADEDAKSRLCSAFMFEYPNSYYGPLLKSILLKPLSEKSKPKNHKK